MSDAVVLTFDPSKRRRRPTANGIDAAYLRRLDLARKLTELEAERSVLRDRLTRVESGSADEVQLLLDACILNADVEDIELELERDNNVVKIGGRRA